MRRLALVAALVAACAFGLPAQAAPTPYAGESSLAAASMLIRGTDSEIWQFEVMVAQHDLEGAKSDYELRIRVAYCDEKGCNGPTYTVPVEAKSVRFTGNTAWLSTTFADATVLVTWTARKGRAEPGVPEPDVEKDGGSVEATTHRQDRSAPALLIVGAARCRTLTSHLANQTGARLTVTSSDSTGEPAHLPSGFFRKGKRLPRCV